MKNLKNIYFYLVVLFSGLSTTFFRSYEGPIVIFIIGLLIFGPTLIRPNKSLLWALGVWISYFIINTLIIKSFHPFFMLTYIINIIISWWIISYYKEKIFIKFENAIYFLSIISLIFYSWQVIHFNSLYSIIRNFDLSKDLFPENGYASILIYSIRGWDSALFLPRNQGFTWEPGPFSCYVALALFFNLARNKNIFKEKLRITIFIIVIVTTQSTTGITLLCVIVLWLAFYRFENIFFRFISIPLTTLVLIYLFMNIPILQEKIISESQQDVEEMIENSIKYNKSYSLGRFASFHLGWTDFKNFPIAGFGGYVNARYAAQQGADINTTNGFARIMGRYGLIGLIIFFMLIITTGKWLSEFYSYKGYFIFPSLILIISFGFGIIETPIFVTLLTSSFFLEKPSFYHIRLWLEKFYFS